MTGTSPTGKPQNTRPTVTPLPALASSTRDEDGLISPDDGVLADYGAALRALAAAYDPADPDDPDLLARHDGEALSGVRSGLSKLAADGQAAVVSFDSDATVLRRESDTAVVRDRLRDRIQLVEATSRSEITEPDSAEMIVDSTLELRDGRWVVVERDLVEAGGPKRASGVG